MLMSKKVGILTAGAWGTAVGKVLADQGNQVQLFDVRTDVVEEINAKHVNSRYLLGIDLPESVSATLDIEEVASGKDFLILVVPSMYLLDIVKRLRVVGDIMEGKPVIGVLTKGFIDTGRGPRPLLEVLEEHLPGFYRDALVYISGPSHAEEVGMGKVTGLIVASRSGKNAVRFRNLLAGPVFIPFPSFDVVGVQTCAAVKNVIAIAFGILDALTELTKRFGDNTESLLLAAGLNEIQALGRALGAEYPETFTSIAGVGDLDVTCRSRYGRNRRFGREIVQSHLLEGFRDLEDLIDRIDAVGYLPEGAAACKHVHVLASRHGLKLPISDGIYRVLNKEVGPVEEVSRMLESMTKSSEGQL
jgi:glycerol-3-phosphate dehydrogenase (NAD(P)+)